MSTYTPPDQKVVHNITFGGFILSLVFQEWCEEKKGIYNVYNMSREKIGELVLPFGQFLIGNNETEEDTINEALRGMAADRYVELAIEYVPWDRKWTIDEYDGAEIIRW
jgi:hypothetical protein